MAVVDDWLDLMHMAITVREVVGVLVVLQKLALAGLIYMLVIF